MSDGAPQVSPPELQHRRQSGQPIDLIDVRTTAEFRQVHATHSRNIPLDVLDPDWIMNSRVGRRDAPLYLICRSGERARHAHGQFVSHGYENVVCVKGGILSWIEAGLPVVRGRKVITLEGQVRIASGLLVLTGGLLGLLLHHGFVWIAVLVGAGLVYAGLTDTCGMASLLIRMPWNRTRQGGKCMVRARPPIGDSIP